MLKKRAYWTPMPPTKGWAVRCIHIYLSRFHRKCLDYDYDLCYAVCVNHTCPRCGVPFVTEYCDQVYCSKRCRKRMAKHRARSRYEETDEYANRQEFLRNRHLESIWKQRIRENERRRERWRNDPEFRSKKIACDKLRLTKKRRDKNLLCKRCGAKIEAPRRYVFCSDKCSIYYHLRAYAKRNPEKIKSLKKKSQLNCREQIRAYRRSHYEEKNAKFMKKLYPSMDYEAWKMVKSMIRKQRILEVRIQQTEGR